ncbi:zinc finger BED domain-containing protein 1-like [Rhizophagus irregularis DAOM 181602=DAOM 197198]|nr:zinc finger BED domain-containing protein 1-like [Rhizophagus irregularis DAOM 181602=DAOM 197198]
MAAWYPTTCIDDHYENFPTLLVKKDQNNKALAKIFILRTIYNLPSRWVLIETLIIQKVFRITLKVNRIIKEENNLTIAFDGWTNSTGQSIYDYCLITEKRKEYLWCSKNYSDVFHHTGAFLGNEIIKIVDDIDPEKVAAVVSDNAPDARVARRILCEKYFHILNIRCMAHCINLITKDVCEHTFVADTVRKVGVIHQYFAMSHAPYQFLKDAIKILQIKGGELKSHTKCAGPLH